MTTGGWLILMVLASAASLFLGFNVGVMAMCAMFLASRDAPTVTVACPLAGAPECPVTGASILDHPANDPMEGG